MPVARERGAPAPVRTYIGPAKLAGIVLILALAYGFMLPFFESIGRRGHDNRRFVCRSNLRNIALACMLYSDDNDDRYPDYLRFDLRVSKGFDVGRGELTVIFEAVNLTNRRNVCCTEDFEFEVDDRGTVTTIPEYGYWAPIIPSVSVRWEF